MILILFVMFTIIAIVGWKIYDAWYDRVESWNEIPNDDEYNECLFLGFCGLMCGLLGTVCSIAMLICILVNR